MADDDLIILDGCTFFYSRANGDVDTESAAGQGFFYMDVRHLSRFDLRVDGEEVVPLTSRRIDYFSARAVGTIESGNKDEPRLTIRRDRFVSEGAHEDVVIENLTPERQDVVVELAYVSDFADAMEAQAGGAAEGRTWQEVRPRSVALWNERDGYRRGTALSFDRKGRVTKRGATFRLSLGPRESWSLGIDITPIVESERRPPLLGRDSFHEHARKMPVSLDDWLEGAPTLETGYDALRHVYHQSLLDLAALRIRPDNVTMSWAMPGGGLPWFMAAFGRDSLIASYQAMPFHQELARATLEALAELQAEEWDDWRDAQPGKIMHELRRGTLAATGRIPHTPYYGAHDTTPLFLIVLDEYERWTGDSDFVRRLEPNARAALAWLEGPADLDADGYIEYVKRSTSEMALDNQGWRDSDDGILFADGRRAEAPIALAEHQGLAYDARRRMARLLREVSGDEEEAARLEEDAAELAKRFNRDFWSTSRGHFVLGLDGEKQQIDSLTSDIGHLLWTGIVEEHRARATVRRLMQPELFSGWGIRSMSSEDRGYNPLGYHRGTVWPHDTSICAEGMRRYGFREEAARLGEAHLGAAEAFNNQLPEVFAGFERDETRMPVEYPDALKPQSWAAGAPLMTIRTLLGLDVIDGKLTSSPALPSNLGSLCLSGLHVRGRQVDV